MARPRPLEPPVTTEQTPDKSMLLNSFTSSLYCHMDGNNFSRTSHDSSPASSEAILVSADQS